MNVKIEKFLYFKVTLKDFELYSILFLFLTLSPVSQLKIV